MKKFHYLSFVIVTVTSLLLLGCSSPADQAQKLFDEGNYEELVTKFESNADLSDIVMQAKEKIAEKWIEEGNYQAVLDTYPDTEAAKVAKNKLAEQMLKEGKYQEVIEMYDDTPAAMQAKIMMEKKMMEDSLAKADPEAYKKMKEEQMKAEKSMEEKK